MGEKSKKDVGWEKSVENDTFIIFRRRNEIDMGGSACRFDFIGNGDHSRIWALRGGEDFRV